VVAARQMAKPNILERMGINPVAEAEVLVKRDKESSVSSITNGLAGPGFRDNPSGVLPFESKGDITGRRMQGGHNSGFSEIFHSWCFRATC
jgi:hypothetical protein